MYDLPAKSLRIVGSAALALSLSTWAGAEDFSHKVLPILKQHCAKCHAGEKKEGGLSMNNRAELLAGGESGKAVIPGEAAKSPVLERITSDDDGIWMPPEGPRVPAEQVAILKEWIERGLPWDEGITLGKSAWEPPLRPREVVLPTGKVSREHPIDRLLDFDLANHDRATPAPISDAAFYRRVSLDAIGLLPSPAALEAFIAEKDEKKREKLTDRLLSDDVAYADHWLTTWNDLLRNDYTGTGFITGGRKQITSWLYASLRDNKPYDQFVRELISPSGESAGFIDGIQWRGDVNASQSREIQFAQNVSQVFLGINMKCASCHDSFIDRWKLSEAYNLAAIYADNRLELYRCDKPTGKMATPKWIFPEIGDVDPNAPKDARLQQLAELIIHPDNGRFTRTVVNRIWHRLMGRGIVHPVDAMHTKPWNEDLLDYLAVRFVEDGYDLRKFIRFVMTSQAYQSRAVVLESEPGEDYAYTGPIAKRMTAEQFIDSIWQITGTHPAKPTANVDRAPREKPADNETQANPAREPLPVTANWIWHPDQGVRRTDLRKSLKLDKAPQSVRMMATCDNTFVMKINGKQAATSKDWQKPVYLDVTRFFKQGENLIEVDAEMFGGACGFICQFELFDGQNSTALITDKTWEAKKSEGPWVAASELQPHGGGPWGTLLDPKAKAAADDSQSPPVRAALVENDFLMRSLGRPHRDQVVTTRPNELTTLQAIDLANGEILAEFLSRGARNLLQEKRSPEELVDWIYRYALSRSPTDDERAVLMDVLSNAEDPRAVEDLLWTVFMLPEFQIVR